MTRIRSFAVQILHGSDCPDYIFWSLVNLYINNLFKKALLTWHLTPFPNSHAPHLHSQHLWLNGRPFYCAKYEVLGTPRVRIVSNRATHQCWCFSAETFHHPISSPSNWRAGKTYAAKYLLIYLFQRRYRYTILINHSQHTVTVAPGAPSVSPEWVISPGLLYERYHHKQPSRVLVHHG